MRPVVRFDPLTDSPLNNGAPSTASSPMECSMVDLVFPMDQEDAVKTPLPFEMTAAAAASTVRYMEHLLAPKSDAELMLARHVELACGGAHRVDPAALVAVLQRLGYSAKLHEATASLHKFKNGVRHQFISVCLPDTGSTGLASYIVEPNFRDCFCVAHPTPRYSAVLESIPFAVVSDKATLHRAISMLSREMARSFSDQGEDLPPWRTPQALLSKWQLSGSSALAAAAAAAGGFGAGGASTSAWGAAAAAAAAAAASGQDCGDLFDAGKHHAAFGAP